jgi:hypothetical protein
VYIDTTNVKTRIEIPEYVYKLLIFFNPLIICMKYLIKHRMFLYLIAVVLFTGMVSTSCSRMYPCKNHPGITQDFQNSQQDNYGG